MPEYTTSEPTGNFDPRNRFCRKGECDARRHRYHAKRLRVPFYDVAFVDEPRLTLGVDCSRPALKLPLVGRL